MLLRRETLSDMPAVRRLGTKAFAVDARTREPLEAEPVEVRLLDQLPDYVFDKQLRLSLLPADST